MPDRRSIRDERVQRLVDEIPDEAWERTITAVVDEFERHDSGGLMVRDCAEDIICAVLRELEEEL